MVKLSEGKISADHYIKYKDRQQYIHFTSSHPNHTKRSIVYSKVYELKGYVLKRKTFEAYERDKVMVL